MSWDLFPLSDVCSINMGQAPAGSSYNQEGKGYALIAGAGDFGELTPEPKKHTTSASKISEVDDLILCIRATIGDLNWSDKKYCLGRGVAGLRPKNEFLDKSYLWHYIGANKDKLASKGTGSTFKQVSRVHISEWEIPVPPLLIQKRIAEILDSASGLRQKRQQSILLAEKFLKSVFLDLFGDPSTNTNKFPIGTIRDLVETVNYGTSAKASETEGEYPILRMGNITYEGNWDFSSLKYVDLTEKDKPKYLVEKGDLLFNRTNSRELVGKTAVFEDDTSMAIAGYLIRVRPNELGNNYYLSGYLNSNHGKQTLLHMCKSIVGMANINAQELQDIKILLPPKELQDRYAEIYKATQQRLKLFETSNKELDDLFNSLSQAAFKGELSLDGVTSHNPLGDIEKLSDPDGTSLTSSNTEEDKNQTDHPEIKVNIAPAISRDINDDSNVVSMRLPSSKSRNDNSSKNSDVIDEPEEKVAFNTGRFEEYLLSRKGQGFTASELWDDLKQASFERPPEFNAFKKLITNYLEGNRILEQIYAVPTKDENNSPAEKRIVLRVKDET